MDTSTSSPTNHILLINCPDEKGLVHKVSGVIRAFNLNMTATDEFVDTDVEHFFMRASFIGDFSPDLFLQALKEMLPSSAHIKLSNGQKKDIVLLATKEYHCLGDLLLRHEFGDLNANIKAVISNHDTLKPLVEKFGIPFEYISHKDKERAAHEQEVMSMIQQYSPEYLVLAKYMRILTPEFVKPFSNRIINIHHSFLPAFVGANPYRQAYNRGVKIIGATAHFVNQELDEGPIIVQDITQTNHSQTAKAMASAGRDVEKVVLAKALKLVFDDRVFVNGNKTIIFD